ncbi:hypothetical protein HanIR_Chr11g0513521 [Helianthus annuus]|nr:hypothetical protein HanIR_Chr11g0513521 [Helianthus annuus]
MVIDHLSPKPAEKSQPQKMQTKLFPNLQRILGIDLTPLFFNGYIVLSPMIFRSLFSNLITPPMMHGPLWKASFMTIRVLEPYI